MPGILAWISPADPPPLLAAALLAIMEEESPIQSLPNELLLAIFGRIQEAEVLLDGVAFVCKRWNALAR